MFGWILFIKIDSTQFINWELVRQPNIILQNIHHFGAVAYKKYAGVILSLKAIITGFCTAVIK